MYTHAHIDTLISTIKPQPNKQKNSAPRGWACPGSFDPWRPPLFPSISLVRSYCPRQESKLFAIVIKKRHNTVLGLTTTLYPEGKPLNNTKISKANILFTGCSSQREPALLCHSLDAMALNLHILIVGFTWLDHVRNESRWKCAGREVSYKNMHSGARQGCGEG